MALKDWVSVGISCAALGVSLTTAYYSVLLEKDDLRVLIGRLPQSEILADQSVEISGSQEFTFINLGNRAALITALGAVLIRIASADAEATCTGSSFPFGVSFESDPFVLKPGEINFKKAPVSVEKKGRDAVVIPKANYSPKQGDTFTACLFIQFAAPDFTQVWFKPAFVFSIQNANGGFGFDRRLSKAFEISVAKTLFTQHEPITIFKRNSNTLWRTIFPPAQPSPMVGIQERSAAPTTKNVP